MLLRRAEGPEGDGAATELGEPALELRLGCVVGQARHVEHLAPFGEEGPDVRTGIHWASEHVRVLIGGLGLPDQTAEDTSEGDSFVHSPAGRGRGESLEMEGQVVLDGSTRLHRLDLESRTDISQRRRAKGQALGMMLLPSLVFGPQIERPGVLEIWREHNGFVAGFSGELDPEVPSIQGYEDEVEVLRVEMLGGEGIETVNSVPERPGIPNVLPC